MQIEYDGFVVISFIGGVGVGSLEELTGVYVELEFGGGVVEDGRGLWGGR